MLIALFQISKREKNPSYEHLVVRHHPSVLAIGLVLSIWAWKDEVDGVCVWKYLGDDKIIFKRLTVIHIYIYIHTHTNMSVYITHGFYICEFAYLPKYLTPTSKL